MWQDNISYLLTHLYPIHMQFIIVFWCQRDQLINVRPDNFKSIYINVKPAPDRQNYKYILEPYKYERV